MARLAIKAIKMIVMLTKLAAAKDKTVREHLGLPPKTHRYWDLYVKFKTGFREKFLATFFPCCCYIRSVRLKKPSGCWRKTFTPKTTENLVLKQCLGLLASMIVSILVYFMIALQEGVSPEKAFYVAAGLSLILSVGLPFFRGFQCFTLLLVPSMASGRGRMLILVYVLYLMMIHPVQNFNNNIVIMSTSSACAQELAMNQTKELISAAVSPMADMLKKIETVKAKLYQFRDRMQDMYKTIAKIVDTIGGAIRKAAKWVKSRVDICNDKIGAPYRNCVKVFTGARDSCIESTIFLLHPFCEIAGALKHICHIARVGELLCIMADFIKRMLRTYITAPVSNQLDKAAEMFYFDVQVKFHFNYTMKQSKSFGSVKKEIITEIRDSMTTLLSCFSAFQKALLLTFAIVFWKTLRYSMKFRYSTRHDNTFITFALRDIDEKHKEQGKASIFPLSKQHRRKIIKCTSPTLLASEGGGMVLSIVMLGVSCLNVAFYIFCDYGLFYILKVINKNFAIVQKVPVPPHMQLHVDGTGPMVDIYKSMVAMFDPMSTSIVSVDISPCLPFPSPPNFLVYKKIGYLLLACLVLTVINPWVMRIRHIIMGCFYPEKDRQRALWLYSHILRTKDPLLDSITNKSKSTLMGDEGRQASFLGNLAGRFPILEKIFKFFGWRIKLCAWCAREGQPDDYINFIHCINVSCDAVYCIDCFADLNDTCNLCMMRLVLDESDSEEIDSSIDEAELVESKKQKRKRQKRIKKLKNERRGSRVMGLVKSNLMDGVNTSANNPTTSVDVRQRRRKKEPRDTTITNVASLFKKPAKNLEFVDDSDASSSFELSEADFAYQYEKQETVPLVSAKICSSDPKKTNRKKRREKPDVLTLSEMYPDSSAEDSDTDTNEPLISNRTNNYDIGSNEIPEIMISRH